jgi:hypothetical protein
MGKGAVNTPNGRNASAFGIFIKSISDALARTHGAMVGKITTCDKHFLFYTTSIGRYALCVKTIIAARDSVKKLTDEG